MFIRSKIILGAVTLILAVPAFAQVARPESVRVRGTLEKADSTSLSVRTREGATTQIALTEKTAYSGVKRLELSDIGPNSYVGVAGRPMGDGNVEALEVLVFPEAARGTGEGQRPWDLLPGSNMTNATVTAVVSSTSGHDLDVNFQGKTVKISVPSTAPIVTLTPAAVNDAVPGLAVVVTALQDASGKLTATRVVLEKNGVKPPM
ncbi:MAG: hypothetical protein JWQ21_353 [Herminiimonas sp.]|nr:hypothetical protein [Herminiimonas sp.]